MIIIGNLTRDPVSRTTRSGESVCNFTVAVNKRMPDGTQGADYFEVSVWGDRGVNCQKYLAKGRKVAVVGPVGLDTYETQDGRHGAKLTMTGFEVEFLTPKNSVAYEETAQENPNNAAVIDQQSGMEVVEQDELPF